MVVNPQFADVTLGCQLKGSQRKVIVKLNGWFAALNKISIILGSSILLVRVSSNTYFGGKLTLSQFAGSIFHQHQFINQSHTRQWTGSKLLSFTRNILRP